MARQSTTTGQEVLEQVATPLGAARVPFYECVLLLLLACSSAADRYRKTQGGDVMTKPANTFVNTLITALAPAAWGTTYLVTRELLPDGRLLFAAATRALPG